MKALTVITALVGVVVADVGIGYEYKVPHTSYGVPFNQYTSGSSLYNTGGSGALGQNSHTTYKGQANNNLGGFQSSNAYQMSGIGQSSGYQNSNYQSALPLQSVAGSNSAYYQQQQKQQQPFNYQYQQQHNYQTASRYQQQYQQYQAQQQPAQVFKHFYVHAAPPEPEVPQFRQPPVLPPPQKHYKIIFIKTPSVAAPAPQYIPVQQQNEEKTIVYVLVKKPEEAGEIVLPKIEQKKPSKPEVYFIKYNSKEDSQGVINNIVADYNNGQGGAVFDGNSASSVDYAGQQETGTLDGISEIFGENAAQGAQAFSSGNQALNSVTSSTSTFGVEQSAGGTNQAQSLGTSSAQSAAFNTQAGSASSSNSLVSSGFTGGDVDSFSGINTSQGLPHETYGPPKFSLQ